MKKSIITNIAVGLACLSPLTAVRGESPRRAEVGVPFFKWFSPQDYAGHNQVRSLIQDDRGVIYAGLDSGMRMFDGAFWRAIEIPDNVPVRSLGYANGGPVFVGMPGNLGYLSPDETGQLRFTSLLRYVPESDRNFQLIRQIHVTPEGVYFVAPERLFRLTREGQEWRIRTWRPPTRFGDSYRVFDRIYIGVPGVGLQKLNRDALETLPLKGLEQSPETSVSSMLPWSTTESGERQILVCTRDGNLQILDDHGLQPFSTGVPQLKRFGVSAGIVLSDGAFGFGTVAGGFLIMEHDGAVRRYLDYSSGIPSDGILSVFKDRSGAAWLGLRNGIVRVETTSPFSEFDRNDGMGASVQQVTRHHGVLYVATMAGLKYFDDKARIFRPVVGAETQTVHRLLAVGDSLLAAGSRNGLFEVNGTLANFAIPPKPGRWYDVLLQSRQDPNRLWIGTDEGLAAILRDQSGHWIDEGIVAKSPEVRSLVEPEPGLLWLGTNAHGVVRVRLRGDSLEQPEVKQFGKADGLLNDGEAYVYDVGGRVVFQGVLEFDSKSGRFVRSPLTGKIPTGSEGNDCVATDHQGNVWISFGWPVLLERQNDGGFKADPLRLRRVRAPITAIDVDDDGIVWFGNRDRLIRYDPAQAKTGATVLQALIRRVTAGENGSRVLFAGDGEAHPPAIDFKHNSLQFEYALPSFEDPAQNQFRTKLEGFDHDWSDWTTQTRRTYTNLQAGEYRFLVKARNMLEQEAGEAGYSLEVLPPWYGTWWAYAIYSLLFVALIAGSARAMRTRLLARERTKSEAKALQVELERKRNVELLSEMGKQLTASLDRDTILTKLYENIRQLVEAPVFAAGLYNASTKTIDYRVVFENGERRPAYRASTEDRDPFAGWSITTHDAVFINDVSAEHSRYFSTYEAAGNGQAPQSLIYLPFLANGVVFGIMTVQNLNKGAYTEYQLNLLKNLAAYTSIALANAEAYLRLKTAQDQLVFQEKLASLGALTAGIAHEIKNPLNFITNFADLSVELADELREDLQKTEETIAPVLFENIDVLLNDLCINAKKINEHGRRADGIVKSMLLHSRGNSGERQTTDINGMMNEYITLAYHGMRAQDNSFNVTLEKDFSTAVGKIDAFPQDLSRVLLNLLNNGFYAINEKKKKAGARGFVPTLRVRTVDRGDSIEIRIWDNGMGIPAEVREKIFNPFFTTKPTGQGTGLGLSISHDIVVQQHGGELEVETEPGKYTEFIVRLPRSARKAA